MEKYDNDVNIKKYSFVRNKFGYILYIYYLSKMRKLIDLTEDVKKQLQKLARKEKRSLKNFIENELNKIAKNRKL